MSELAGGNYPATTENAAPVAWRCEQCKKLQPTRVPSQVIHVDEVQTAWAGTTVRRHARFARRMVVCPPCRRAITDMPASVTTLPGGMQESSNDG